MATLTGDRLAHKDALGIDPGTAAQIGLGHHESIPGNPEMAGLVSIEVRRDVAALDMGNPDTASGIDLIGAEVGAVPARDTCVRIRVGCGFVDVGRIAHHAERNVPTGRKDEVSQRLFTECEDRFAMFRRVHILHEEPRSDERVCLVGAGGHAD